MGNYVFFYIPFWCWTWKKNIKIEINFTREGAVLGELKGEMRVDMIVFNYIHV